MKMQKHNMKNQSENNITGLCNISNYKSIIENTVTEILTKFVSIIMEYMRFISEKIVTKNSNYYNFIFERGLETIIHIFSLIFYYTKNIDITCYYTQKAYYCYIEFIEQISDENAKFLQLSSRDAILFVYKKTIFELNNEYIKNTFSVNEDEKLILSSVTMYTELYKTIILCIVNKINGAHTKLEYINICCNKMETISALLNKNKIKKMYVEYIYLFIHAMSDKQVDVHICCNMLDEFIKKVSCKKKWNDATLKNKLYRSVCNEYIEQNGIDNIISWLFIE